MFEPVNACWRGIGIVENTGLCLRKQFSKFDVSKELGIKLISEEKEEKGCSPENPVGACMVSDEGTCSVYYRFKSK